MKAQIFRGHPDGRFTEISANQAGALFDTPRLGRGMALIDWNRDGMLDFVATDLEQPVMLAENQSYHRNQSLRIKLIGTRSNRDAIGAKIRITVTAGEERFFQITAGDGYQSSNERNLCIGVGRHDRVEQIEIKWPSGFVTNADNVTLDREWLVVEDFKEWLPRPE